MSKQAVFAACAIGALLIPRADAAELGNVLPLGDSITWGDAWTWTGGHWGAGIGTRTAIPGGYRDRLYTSLHNAGMTLQFVGTDTANANATLAAAGQTANEGHPGYFTGNIDGNLDGSSGGDPGHWLTGLGDRPAIYPDTVLLRIGTVDLLNGFGPAYDATVILDSLIDHLFALRPNAHVYIGELLPMPDFPAASDQVPIYNSYLPGEVAKFQGQGHAITLVPAYKSFVNADGSANASLFFDGVHPNKAGYDTLGDTWATAILQGRELNVSGPVTLRPGATGSTVGHIAFSGDGVLTLALGELVCATSFAEVATDIAAAKLVGEGGRALVYADAGNGKTEIVSAIGGDANFDGAVNVADLGVLATHYNTSNGATWAGGDFDLNGAVDVGDLGILATSYGQATSYGPAAMTAATAATASRGVEVPEPGLSVLGVVSLAILVGRRRMRQQGQRVSGVR